MAVVVKTIALAKNCITNHGLIKLIMLYDLSHQGKISDEFMINKARTTRRKRFGTSKEAQTKTKE